MIAIFSKKDFEVSTEEVIDWLIFINANFIRINGRDYMERIRLLNSELDTELLLQGLKVEDINICWFRRWSDDKDNKDVFIDSSNSNENAIELSNHIGNEKKLLNTLLWNTLKDKRWLSNPTKSYSKLTILRKAEKVGLGIPETLITTSKQDLKLFKAKRTRIITKSISDATTFNDMEKIYMLRTKEVDDLMIDRLSDNFFPSLFQELVDKEYELRIFFLAGNFYSMAIFSQLDEQTKIDFRNYNHQRPNRRVPYKLPIEVEEKLKRLLDELEIITGSIDMIKNINGDYIFLEINEVGQFGMTSMPCNYNLEKKIANYLANQDE